jgi:hypothetical protein
MIEGVERRKRQKHWRFDSGIWQNYFVESIRTGKCFGKPDQAVKPPTSPWAVLRLQTTGC